MVVFTVALTTQSSSSGKSFSVARRPLITPSELMAWSARENGALVIDAEGPMALASRDITETFLGPLLGMTSPEAEGALLARALEGEVRNTSPGTGVAHPGEAEKAQGVAVRRQEAQGIRRARRVLMRHTALPAKTARRHTAREARMTAGRGGLSVYLSTLPAETNSARRVAPQNPGRP